MNKTVLATTLLAIGLTLTSLLLYTDRQKQDERLALYADQLDELMAQVEQRSLDRVDFEQRLLSLQRELASSKDQLLALSNELAAEKQKARPEYERMEREIRRKMTAEMVRSSPALGGDRIELIRSLTALSPEELSNIMMVQGLFGEFLDSLDVSDQRMDVIIGALDELVREQNEKQMAAMAAMEERMAAIREAIENGEPPSGETASVMFAESFDSLYDLESQIEALSYDLSPDELEAFRQHQERQQANARRGLSLGGGTTGAFIGGASGIRSVMINDGDGTSETTEIIASPGFYSTEPVFIEMETNVIEPEN